MVWVLYMGLGIKYQGVRGYFRSLTIPSGSPAWILPLLVPIEFLSNVLIRPFTLSVRLFANMLAGHVLLLVFSLATWYLLTASISILYSATSFFVLILVTGLEVLVQVAAGLHLHDPDRHLYLRRVRSRALSRPR